MLFVLLLLPVVFGFLAPLHTQERTVDKGDLRSYIVVFVDDFPAFQKDSKAVVMEWIAAELPSLNPLRVDAAYNIDTFRGFASYLNAAQLEEVRRHPAIKYVAEDSIATATAFTDRQDWGQIRVNQKDRNLQTNNNQYAYTGTNYPNQNLDITVWDFAANIQAPFANVGLNAEVCIIDTGVRATHQEIAGRVDAQITYTNDTNGFQDGNGHGTHVAGSCCGAYRGVAPSSRIVSCKGLSNSGSGQWTWIISCIDWCAARHVAPTTRTYITSMSLGGAINTAVNDAINAAAARTIPVVAAGNENTDACTRSPASAAGAITVMASEKDDLKASFSNFGRCCELWAPGVNIHSGWFQSDTQYNTISGTSMATPLVAGLIAGYADTEGQTINRNAALAELEKHGTWGQIRNPPANTVNLLGGTGRSP